MSEPDVNRRGFLKRGAALTGLGLSAPWAMNLAAMADAAAQQAGNAEYKALVCVFLQGGNDQANTLIPYDADGHGLYSRLRGNLALSRGSLAATVLGGGAPQVGLPTGRQVALAPALAPLLPLYEAKRLAVLLNIGPLVRPVSKAQFQEAVLGVQDGQTLPPKLFSHNDQQSVWQSHQAEGASVGWGGRIADAGLGGNANSALTCVNLAGNVVYGAGLQAGQFMVNPMGPDALLAEQADKLFGSAQLVAAFKSLAGTEEPSVHRLAKEHSAIMRRAMRTNAILLEQLKQADALVPPLYPADGSASVHSQAARLQGNTLAEQLNTAARIMAINTQLGIKRQVFFVSMGGFDLHDNLINRHAGLLGKLAQALAQLDDDLHLLGLRNQVTTFTASDFGRTISSNGDGSDHGWGSHHFVMGGAVQGGRFHGTWPDVTDHDAGADNIGQGRLLPSLSVDHLAARLASWMGVTDAQALRQLAPNLGNFPTSSPLANLF